MAEESKTGKEPQKRKINVPHLCINTIKTLSRSSSSIPSSPVSLRKAASTRNNCLCSPTTHVGSFRCRYHRSSSLTRNSMSIGSKLAELAGKSTDMCGNLHTQLIAGHNQGS
ncbi:hypothetical protein CDL12_15887 [Handroanthus impetiginosus]|uniref:Uncharacterized protein n=1 Tax=Handroanthus impetiginosus TaxID=429701 RepID=A0A2G9H1W5_9LAMI|nr:hypothetical protein CDL12_15887 [Handroanthus impetiginosus]